MTSIAAEPVFFIGNFGITNTVLNTILVDSILIGGILYLKKKKLIK
ncbi:MAG: hypothetical protein M1450_02455 [Patescibacteria group bacterium]|nr:hypothetical protein [Patescibacteria group bacterium]